MPMSTVQAIAIILACIALYLTKGWFVKWLQKAQDQKNKEDIGDESTRSDTINQKLNQDWDKLNGGDSSKQG